MTKYKVLVVDDSAFMRRMIADIINSDPGLEVVERAKNGRDALEKIAQFDPDVVTMDVEMPEMNGIATLEAIMKSRPRPVVMLSSFTQAGAEQTMRALEIGAVDFIAKPSGQISLDIEKMRDEIIGKVKAAAALKSRIAGLSQMYRNTGMQARASSAAVPAAMKTPDKPYSGAVSVILNKLVLIGTSTGGPKALHEVIPQLPAGLPAAVLVVQHMPPGFTKSLADRLDTVSNLRVKEAEQGDIIRPGYVYIAPGDNHLNVLQQNDTNGKKLLVQLTKNPPRGTLRPSVDEMFESVADQFWSKMIGVIMTGMGNDGVLGIKYLKERGAALIAEDQSTCVVFGMPKSAIDTGLVDRIVPLPRISQEIVKLLQS